MNIMVTGANGAYGSLAIDYLQKFLPDAKLFGLVRNESKGINLKKKGINVRIGDYADLDSMRTALRGIDRLLFVSLSIPGIQKNVVEAAKENNVKYIAYTSIFQPEYDKFGLEINHKQTEQWIKDSGIPHTFLRNSWYMELNQGLFDYAKKTKKFEYFATKGKLSFALKREYAEAGARVIATGNEKEIINLANTPYSYLDMAEATKQAMNEDIEIKQIPMADYIPDLVQAGIDQQWAGVSESYQEYTFNENNGEENADKTEFERILGHPLTSLA